MDNVQRLHRALVDAMQRTRGDDFERPITVSQIYQELVPYRVARSIGFDMNADYEFALLRLLSGDYDLARLEPEEIRTMLRKEAESPNPNVSLFRAYANCDVWIAPPQEWMAEPVGSDVVEFDFEPEQTDSLGSAEPIEAYEFVPDDTPDPDAAPPPAEELPLPQIISTGPAPGAGRRTQCSFCGGDLPASRLVNFCPSCGNDLTQQPCSNCGETLETGWRFCVNCGAAANNEDSQAN